MVEFSDVDFAHKAFEQSLFEDMALRLAASTVKNMQLSETIEQQRATIEKQEERLSHQELEVVTAQSTDNLTGLLSREGAEEEYQVLCKHTRAEDEPKPTVIAFLDLDNFGVINSQHSFSTGDEVLREVANRMKIGFRHDDIIARYGGDEFVLLLHNIEPHEAERILYKFLATLREPIKVDNKTFNVSASIGLDKLDRNKSFSEMHEMAEAAMRYAKRKGRNQVVTLSEKTHFDTKRRKIVAQWLANKLATYGKY